MKILYAAVLGIATSVAVFAFTQLIPEDTPNKSGEFGWIAALVFSVILGFLVFARATNLGRKNGLLPPKGS